MRRDSHFFFGPSSQFVESWFEVKVSQSIFVSSVIVYVAYHTYVSVVSALLSLPTPAPGEPFLHIPYRPGIHAIQIDGSPDGSTWYPVSTMTVIKPSAPANQGVAHQPVLVAPRVAMQHFNITIGFAPGYTSSDVSVLPVIDAVKFIGDDSTLNPVTDFSPACTSGVLTNCWYNCSTAQVMSAAKQTKYFQLLAQATTSIANTFFVSPSHSNGQPLTVPYARASATRTNDPYSSSLDTTLYWVYEVNLCKPTEQTNGQPVPIPAYLTSPGIFTPDELIILPTARPALTPVSYVVCRYYDAVAKSPRREQPGGRPMVIHVRTWDLVDCPQLPPTPLDPLCPAAQHCPRLRRSVGGQQRQRLPTGSGRHHPKPLPGPGLLVRRDQSGYRRYLRQQRQPGLQRNHRQGNGALWRHRQRCSHAECRSWVHNTQR